MNGSRSRQRRSSHPNVQLHHSKMSQGARKARRSRAPDHPYLSHSTIHDRSHFFFDDAPEEKGAYRIPGSHKLGPLEHQSEGGWHLSFEEYPLSEAVPCRARAGDVLFFSYLTVHGSGLNTSSDARTTLLVQMRDPEDPPLQDVHRSRGQGMMLAARPPCA